MTHVFPSFSAPHHRGSAVLPFRTVTIGDGEVGAVFRHGCPAGTLPPGRHRINSSGVTVRVVDLRPQLAVLPLQEVPTADGVTVRVSVGLIRRVIDVEGHLAAGTDADSIAYLRVQVALRELVAGLTYEDLLAARSTLGERLRAGIGDLDDLGLVVDRAEVRDLVLPADLRRAQAAVLLARAEGQAALERARGETAALRSLANAARLAADNPALLQLRLIQQLESSTGHTVVLSDRTPG